ncbi:MAG: GTP pyrophosphokinase family protein [Clostridia bacterium]|nr:GTP pyrophosphokinase family protein [Clostridia bacterium]
MAKELVKFTKNMNFNEEMMLDMLEDSILPVEQFFANYSCAIMEIETKFKVLNEQFSLKYDGNPIESIHSRVKDYDSIIRKVIRKNLPRSLDAIEENIHDIAGVRVVCSFVDDIYRLADCLLQQDDIILIRKKDYIKNPKPTGYRSLHLIVAVPIFLENEKKLVKVEVQLRTIAMDFWASLEHKMRYKKNISPEMLDNLSHELTDCAEISASLDSRMQNVRNLILSETANQ